MSATQDVTPTDNPTSSTPATDRGHYLEWPMLVTFMLGFADGLPLVLTAGTLRAWLATGGVSMTTIGTFALVGLPYTWKFAWAPFMERFIPPFLGRRRGWILITQIAMMALIVAMGWSDPINHPARMAVLAVLVAFFSASHGNVVDAYRVELLPVQKLGYGTGLYIMGYRLGMILAGAGALILSDHLSWGMVYTFLAATLSVGMFAAIFGPEPVVKTALPNSLKKASFDAFLEFLKRPRSFEIMIFLVIYKIDFIMADMLSTPFMLKLGFSKTEIGAISKGFGVATTIIGTGVGGALMNRLGIFKSLWSFGILQALSGLSYMLLAHVGHNYSVLVMAIAVDNFCAGMATTAYTAFMGSVCDKRFTATQYALLASLMAIPRYLVGPPAGWIADHASWEQYFLITTLIGIPGLVLLMTRYRKWGLPEREAS